MQNRGEKLKNFSVLIFICRPSKKFALGRTASPASPRDASVLVKLNIEKRILFEWLLALGRACIIDSAYYRFCHGPSRTSRGLFVALLLKPSTSLSSHLLKSSYQGRPIRCGLASVRPPRLCRHRGTKSYPFLAHGMRGGCHPSPYCSASFTGLVFGIATFPWTVQSTLTWIFFPISTRLFTSIAQIMSGKQACDSTLSDLVIMFV
ncbi:hypothetical protein V8C40DRAFT_255268 [Trichoderma camerunense]